MTVPRIVHQTWKDNNIPCTVLEYVNSWKRGEFKYRFYTDNALRSIISNHYPQYLKHYDGFGYNIERVDFARYAILNRYGGIYADLDTEYINPFPEEWFDKTNIVILGYEPPEHKINDQDLICNALMISSPGHKYWIKFIDFICKTYNSQVGPVINTGPMAMSRFKNAHESCYKNVMLLDCCAFFPLTNKKTDKSEGRFEAITSVCSNVAHNSYVVHYWTGTWYRLNDGQWTAISIAIILSIVLVAIIVSAKLNR